MEAEVLVKVEGLSKKFSKSLKKSLKYGVYDLMANLRGKEPSKTLRPDEFWALRDINFEVRRGECLGLIGHNGAGKSTLLKILNGLINPDQGKVTMRGRVGALIELGAGFNPIMTGRENIYNNGAVLGFTRDEINTKVEEIIDFAELREFIDMPVQNYSSGMKVRLGFAVAAQMEPDVLIIDEVLAVGDVGFRGKCYKAIGDLSKKCAVIFVSHSMPMISRISSNAILLKGGKISYEGRPSIAIEKYYDNFNTGMSVESIKSDFLMLRTVNFLENKDTINYGEGLKIMCAIESVKNYLGIEINMMFLSRELIPVAQFNSKFDNKVINLNSGLNKINIELHTIFLTPGEYYLSISLHDMKTNAALLWTHGIKKLKVLGLNREFGSAPYIIDSRWDF